MKNQIFLCLALIIFGLSSLNASLLGYWAGDVDGSVVTDSSGNNHHGSFVGNAAVVSGGKEGNGFIFDGSADAITIPHAIIDVRQAYTLTAWIFMDNSPTNVNVAILNKDNRSSGGNSVDMGMFLSSQTGIPRSLGLCHIGDSSCAVFSNSQIQLGQFTHIAIAYNGFSQAEFYINGVLDSVHAAGDPTNNVGTWQIGSGAIGNETFNGIIDEVAIFDERLDGSQIVAIVNNGVIPVPEPSTWCLLLLGFFFSLPRKK